MLQDVTLLLEIVGLLIAMLEVKFPKKADQVESFIDRTGDRFFNKSSEYNNSRITRDVFFSIGTVGFLFLMGSLVTPISNIAAIVCVIIMIPSAIVIAIALLAEFIDWLNWFSGGQAITSLGLLIASVGAVIETVQWVLGYF